MYEFKLSYEYYFRYDDICLFSINYVTTILFLQNKQIRNTQANQSQSKFRGNQRKQDEGALEKPGSRGTRGTKWKPDLEKRGAKDIFKPKLNYIV